MAEKKSLDYSTRTWSEAVEKLLRLGVADIFTGAQQTDEWNKKVARRLTNETGLHIVLAGLAPGHTESNSTYRYMVEVNNNRDAARLLSKTDD